MSISSYFYILIGILVVIVRLAEMYNNGGDDEYEWELDDEIEDFDEYEPAYQDIEVHTVQEPENPPAPPNDCYAEAISLYNEAQGLEKNKQADVYRQSLSKFEEAASLSSGDSQVFQNWGLALYQLAQLEENNINLYEQSYVKFNEALRLNPNDSQTLTCWGMALLSQSAQNSDKDLYRQSCDKFEKAIQTNRAEAEGYRRWGEALIDAGRSRKDAALYKEAGLKYDKVMNLVPGDASAYFYKGQCLIEEAWLKGNKYISARQIEGLFVKAIGLPEDGRFNHIDAFFYLLRLYAFVDDKSRFFLWFEKALGKYGNEIISRVEQSSGFDAILTSRQYKELIETH